MAATVTVNDVLDGHVGLDVECLDRIYLNGYVPNLQVGGQVVSFMTEHLGYPIPSPAIMEKIGTAFRRAVASFADADHIPVVRFAKDDRKIDVMRRIWLRRRRPAGPGWPRSGWPRSSRTCSPRATHGPPRDSVVLVHQGRPAGDVFLLLPLGRRLRAGVHQGLRLLPVSDQGVGQRARVGQAPGRQAGIGFTELSNGFAAATIRRRCRRSATGSARARSRCSSSAG